MAVNTTFRTVKFAYECALDPKQIVLQCNLDTSAKGGVSRVCFCAADAKVTATQAMSKMVHVSGNASIKLMYLDAQGEIRSMDYLSDFADDVADDRIAAEMPLRASASVTDIQTAINGNEIRVQFVVTLQIHAIESRTMEVLDGVTGALMMPGTIRSQEFTGYIHETTDVQDTCETGMPIDEILLFDVRGYVSHNEEHDDKRFIQGQVVADVVFRSGEEIHMQSLDVPFLRETAYPAQAQGCIGCEIADSKLIVEGTDQSGILRMEATVCLTGAMFLSEEIPVVADVDCPTCRLDVRTDRACYPVHLATEQIKERLIANTQAGEKDLATVRVLQLLRSELTSVRVSDGEIACEGVLSIGAICNTTDGENVCHTIEVPFALQAPCAGAKDGDSGEAQIAVSDLNGRIRRDREIEVGVSVAISVCIRRTVCVQAIVGVTEGEAIEPSKNGIVAFFPSEGMRLWDVAKALGMPTEEILRQNPTLTEPLRSSDRVVVYKGF